jgi:hypothetical protein
MPRALQPINSNVSVPIAGAIVMVRNVRCKRPPRLELVVRLLDSEA